MTLWLNSPSKNTAMVFSLNKTNNNPPGKVNNTLPVKINNTLLDNANTTRPGKVNITWPANANNTLPGNANNTRPGNANIANNTQSVKVNNALPGKTNNARPGNANNTRSGKVKNARPAGKVRNTRRGKPKNRWPGKANNTQFQFVKLETKGCSDIHRNPVVIQVERNRTSCPSGQNCVVMVNRTKIVTTRFNVCWEIINKLRPLLYALGTIAIVSNTIVVGTVLRVKSLRKCSPFLLVSHMSFCDILIGVYAFGMAFAHSQNFQEFNAWKKIYCPALGSMFILAEVVGGLTSLLMTTERYFAIVFCMKPDMRLGRRAITAALVLFWIAGASSVTLVQLLDARSTQPIGQMCLINRNSNKISTLFVYEVILLFLVFVYLIVVGLYFHIFTVVRRSARNLGVLRECKVAKRISSIVLSSFVFFAAPNMTLAWFILQGGGVFEDARLNRIILWWLPPVCLVVNACLNPCLFAFKNDKFITALGKVARSPFGRILTTKQRPKRHDVMASSSVDPLASVRYDSTPTVELIMFNYLH